MKPNTLRIIFIVLFAFISAGALISLVYWGFLTLFGVGWGGGTISTWELIWMWKGLIVLLAFSTFSFIGLAKPRKYGLIFGYSIPFGLIVYLLLAVIEYTIYDFKNDQIFDFEYLMSLLIQIIIIIGIGVLFIFGLNKLAKQYFNLKPMDYGITVGLSIVLFLSLHFMFD